VVAPAAEVLVKVVDVKVGIEVWEKVGVDVDGTNVFDVRMPVRVRLAGAIEKVTLQLVKIEDLLEENGGA
jgi:hypothetical protein